MDENEAAACVAYALSALSFIATGDEPAVLYGISLGAYVAA